MAIIDTRRAQMFPVLADAQLERLRRFGEPRHYRDGERARTLGEPAGGILVILTGAITVSHRDAHGADVFLTEMGPHEFQGELAQLTGRPSFVDARAKGDVEALLIPP
jgi:thioredoxin reductase (NADPH)